MCLRKLTTSEHIQVHFIFLGESLVSTLSVQRVPPSLPQTENYTVVYKKTVKLLHNSTQGNVFLFSLQNPFKVHEERGL